MPVDELRVNINSRRDKIFLLMEELRRLRIQQRLKVRGQLSWSLRGLRGRLLGHRFSVWQFYETAATTSPAAPAAALNHICSSSWSYASRVEVGEIASRGPAVMGVGHRLCAR